MLLDYGAMGLVGNALLSRHIERVGASRAVFMALMCIATGMLLTPWTNHWIASGLALLPWGLGVFASNSALQARLVNQAPWLASASVGLNTSAIYAGQALGATIGAAMIVHQTLTSLPHFSLMGMLMALGLSALATRYARLHPLSRPG